MSGLRVANQTSTSVTITWNEPHDGGARITGYGVLRRERPAAWPPFRAAEVVGGRSKTYRGLNPGTSDVRVHACNGPDRCGVWSVPLSFTVPMTAEIRLPKTTIAIGERISVGAYDVPLGEVAYLQLEGPIQPQGRCPAGGGARGAAPRPSTGPGYYDSLWIDGCAPGGTATIRLERQNGSRVFARATLTVAPAATTRPGRVARPQVTVYNAALEVTWRPPSDGGAPAHYDVRHRPETSGGWRERQSPDDGSMILDQLTNGVTYQVQVRACNTHGCSDSWSKTATGTPSSDAPNVISKPEPPRPPVPIAACGSIAPGALAKPTDLDIIPYPQRRALLTWVGSEAATHYSGRITRVDTSTSVTFSVANDPCWQIDLDNILGKVSPEGLAHATAFQFEVTAQVIAPDGTVSLSEGPSETVTLVDNPILSINGNSKDTEDGKVQAVVRWSKVSGATNYIIRYHELPGDHWLPGWTVAPRTESLKQGTISILANPSDPDVLMRTIGGTTDTLHPLDRHKIYAVSVNYRKGSDRYFAAHEAYVWPSDRPAYGVERVGSFPLVHALTNKTYSYRICTETFVPAGTLNARRNSWVSLIDKALEHWMTATQGLITVQRDTEPCENYDVVVAEIRQDIEDFLEDDQQDMTLEGFLNSYMESLRDRGTVRGSNVLSKTQNEVYMFNDMSGTNLLFYKEGIFDEIASDIGHECWREIVAKGKNIVDEKPDRVAVMCVQSEDDVEIDDVHGNRRTEHFSDIIVRRSAYEKSYNKDTLPWGSKRDDDPLQVPSGTVRFNTCRSSIPVGTAYEDMLHEGGHALGIRGGAEQGWANPQHPQISGSVVNYDHIAVPIDPQTLSVNREDYDRDFEEFDCAPHPLDLMAIYALYQTD